MMSPTAQEQAKREIDASLIYCTTIMSCFGLSFEKSKDNIAFIKQTLICTLFVILACTHFSSEVIYIVVTGMNSPRIEDVVPLLHTVVYTIISFTRISAIWYKKNVFGRLLRELADIWPVPPLTDEAQLTKHRSLFLLRLAHQWYFALSVICDIFFNSTPIAIYFYEVWQGHENPEVGFVWVCWYPFDKHRLIPHILVYLFEMFSGLTSLFAMVSADLLFTAIASHICLLLRILHQRHRALGSENQMQSQNAAYKEVIECVKLHQRLITYCNEMEETFSVVNLINVMLSSVAICCVVFVVVLLDPPFEVSNKLFAMTFIIQIGLVCWYSDDTFKANADVAIAAYDSLWYSADPRCRRALLLLIIRAQKPIGFTAMKFAALNLTTYSAIIAGVDASQVVTFAYWSFLGNYSRMMPDSKRQVAKREIDKSLIYTTRIMTAFGLCFELDLDKKTQRKYQITFITFAILVCIHILSEIAHILVTIANSPRMEDVVPLFHTVGYSTISAARLFAIYFKKDMFSQLLHELVDIWPVPPLTEDSLQIKKQSLIALELAHKLYFRLSIACDVFYNAQPILIYFYEVWQGIENPEVGYVWVCWYPFDKHQWAAHIFVYSFEMLSGFNCMLAMVSSDLLFTGMASHICMALRMLHQRLEALGSADDIEDQDVLYSEVIDSIKLHQRLIKYCNEMEETFSVVNLINVVLSSMTISCVVLVIVLLDPMFALGNKLFLVISLIQIGVVCWYSDDIFRANGHVGIAAYNSGWYKVDARSRRALMLLILRSQKPIGFTAMGFTDLNLNTYSTILTRAYSYFTLLYTMFSEN